MFQNTIEEELANNTQKIAIDKDMNIKSTFDIAPYQDNLIKNKQIASSSLTAIAAKPRPKSSYKPSAGTAKLSTLGNLNFESLVANGGVAQKYNFRPYEGASSPENAGTSIRAQRKAKLL